MAEHFPALPDVFKHMMKHDQIKFLLDLINGQLAYKQTWHNFNVIGQIRVYSGKPAKAGTS